MISRQSNTLDTCGTSTWIIGPPSTKQPVDQYGRKLAGPSTTPLGGELAEHARAGDDRRRGLDVAAQLLHERVDGLELELVAEPLEEPHRQRLPVQVALEPDEVHLDR